MNGLEATSVDASDEPEWVGGKRGSFGVWGKSRKGANQMFHKREPLGSHSNALFSAWKGPQEDSQ